MATSDIIPNLITATETYSVLWRIDNISEIESNRIYSLGLNAGQGIYTIVVSPSEAWLYNHNGDPLMDSYTNPTKIGKLRSAIELVVDSTRTNALNDIDVYVASLVA